MRVGGGIPLRKKPNMIPFSEKHQYTIMINQLIILESDLILKTNSLNLTGPLMLSLIIIVICILSQYALLHLL